MTSTETHLPTTPSAAEHLAATSTVRDIALHHPTAIRVFDHLGIDYCCGGDQTLASACAVVHLDPHAVQLALEFAAGRHTLPMPDWSRASLELLCAHIVVKHHAFSRRELPRLVELSANVLARHGAAHPELAAIHTTLSQLELDINGHLAKEESVIFPYIVSLERSVCSVHEEPVSCYGFLPDPVALLSHDHEEAAAMLLHIRQLSHNYTPPLGVCLTYRIFYTGLQEFESDLRQHTYLENNILFPRAVRLEAATAFATA
jgi:regulator of cell morphogenesis and NO signaling